MQKRRSWLIPGMVAAVLFVGAVASNLVATELEITLKPYRLWVWLFFAITLIVAVAAAIIEARRRPHSSDSDPNHSARVETTGIVNASAERSVAISGDVNRSTIVTGDENIIGNRFNGDIVARDKIVHIHETSGPPANALHQLRAPVGEFVGRQREIDTLINALRSGGGAVITGMGGIGKTELALLVAERVSDDFPDAQLFLNLQGTDANPRTPQELLGTSIRAFLGPEAKLPDDLEQLSQRYRSLISGKRVLLLLDNAAEGAQVRSLLPPNGSALLITSRRAIALPGIRPLTLTPLTEDEARKLLLDIAPRAEPVANEICERCGYLPLAIRAAGSLLATTADLDPVDYAAQLKDERKRLERLGTEGVDIGVEASFNLSYARLTVESASVFRLLSVFPASFDAAAEEVVCVDANHVQLTDLLRRSLVLYDDGTKRYRLHDLARLFANAKLNEEARAVGLKRFATHYKDVLAAAQELSREGGGALVRGLALFDLEWNNIQAGHAWVEAAADTTDEDVTRLGIAYPAAGVDILDLRQDSRERIRWLKIAISAAQRLKDRQAEGNALGPIGIAYAELGETGPAIRYFEEQLTIARELGDRRGEGIALSNLGSVYKNLQEPRRAVEFHKQALRIFRELSDRKGEGIALSNLGSAYKNLGRILRAIQFYKQALLIFRELRDRRGEGIALANLGAAYKNLKETRRAIEFHEQALIIHRELRDRRSEGSALWNMSRALDQLGERDQAIEYAEQALIIREQIEDPSAPHIREQLAEWREEKDRRTKAT